MNNLQYWLALNSLPDIGPVVARNLLSAFGSPHNIFNMTIAELRQVFLLMAGMILKEKVKRQRTTMSEY
jgi:ERCC4-type nuclease